MISHYFRNIYVFLACASIICAFIRLATQNVIFVLHMLSKVSSRTVHSLCLLRKALVGFEAVSRDSARAVSVSGKQGRPASVCEREHGTKYSLQCLPTGPQGPTGLL